MNKQILKTIIFPVLLLFITSACLGTESIQSTDTSSPDNSLSIDSTETNDIPSDEVPDEFEGTQITNPKSFRMIKFNMSLKDENIPEEDIVTMDSDCLDKTESSIIVYKDSQGQKIAQFKIADGENKHEITTEGEFTTEIINGKTSCGAISFDKTELVSGGYNLSIAPGTETVDLGYISVKNSVFVSSNSSEIADTQPDIVDYNLNGTLDWMEGFIPDPDATFLAKQIHHFQNNISETKITEDKEYFFEVKFVLDDAASIILENMSKASISKNFAKSLFVKGNDSIDTQPGFHSFKIIPHANGEDKVLILTLQLSHIYTHASIEFDTSDSVFPFEEFKRSYTLFWEGMVEIVKKPFTTDIKTQPIL